MVAVSQRQALVALAIQGGIVALSVVAVTILGYHGALDAQAVTAILGAAIGFAGAGAASGNSLAQAVNGKATIPEGALAAREETVRAAITGAPLQSHSPPPPPGG